MPCKSSKCNLCTLYPKLGACVFVGSVRISEVVRVGMKWIRKIRVGDA